jgi:hypothetical protein
MKSESFPCLSVRQPWADLIVDGIKDVENRSWSTSFRGLILIHAPRTVDHAALPDVTHLLGLGSASEYRPVIGAIIGHTEIIDCVRRHPSRFFQGPYGFVLANSQRFPQPIPSRGQLGIFEVPAGIIRERNYEFPIALARRRS